MSTQIISLALIHGALGQAPKGRFRSVSFPARSPSPCSRHRPPRVRLHLPEHNFLAVTATTPSRTHGAWTSRMGLHRRDSRHPHTPHPQLPAIRDTSPLPWIPRLPSSPLASSSSLPDVWWLVSVLMALSRGFCPAASSTPR